MRDACEAFLRTLGFDPARVVSFSAEADCRVTVAQLTDEALGDPADRKVEECVVQ